MPVHARVIAGSATTSILTTQLVSQQCQLQQAEKRMEDMKAALHLACGVLRQTNYMERNVSGRPWHTVWAYCDQQAGQHKGGPLQMQQFGVSSLSAVTNNSQV